MTDSPIHNHLVNVPPEDRMEALIEFLSSYIEQYHGGHVRMISYDDGVLKVEMGGACEGCPMSNNTLHGWVEGTVRQFFPELVRVEEINK
ncbi:MAG: NifU family protein [Anaerolineales bacterium]|jgi:Fe-S cluster biogenesis protein NfuA